MGFTSFLSDLYSSITPTELHAEAPSDASEKAAPEADVKEEEEEAEEAEEEEAEEEEPEDIQPKLTEECENSKECAPAKHHYDHCVERVTKKIEDDGKSDEDCVEEFFHLAHCATACAAPKLFKQLK